MNILFVCSGNSPSDFSNLPLSQANSLVSHDVKIDMYYIKGKGVSGYLKNIIPIRKFIRNNHYNLIHAHYGLSGWIALFGRSNEKLIISFMGSDILGDHANFGKTTLFGYLMKLFNKHLAKYADHVIVKSSEMSSKLSSKNISIIPNGVCLKTFYNIDRQVALRRIGWDARFSHILFLSNPLRPEKNFSLAKAAIKYLRMDWVKLHYLNQIPHTEVVFYYNASNVCLLTSFHEGSPNVIKEAMACNAPIVSTDVGDVKELFGSTPGCYITNLHPINVADNIKQALEFSNVQGYTNGRERIIELNLDCNIVAKKILEIYSYLMINKEISRVK